MKRVHGRVSDSAVIVIIVTVAGSSRRIGGAAWFSKPKEMVTISIHETNSYHSRHFGASGWIGRPISLHLLLKALVISVQVDENCRPGC